MGWAGAVFFLGLTVSSYILRLRFIGACFMVHPRVAQAVSELWAVLKDLTWRVMNQLAEVPCAINKNQDWHELTCDGLKPLCRMPNAMENFLRVSCQGSSKGLQNRSWAWVEWCWVVNRGKKVLDVYNCKHIYIYIFMYIIYIPSLCSHFPVMHFIDLHQNFKHVTLAKEHPLLHPLRPLWLPWRSSWFGTDAQCTTRYFSWYATWQRKTWQDMDRYGTNQSCFNSKSFRSAIPGIALLLALRKRS